MSHKYTKIYIHVVLVVKNRQALIRPEIEQLIYKYLCNRIRQTGSTVLAINGVSDHIHILIHQPPYLALSDIIKQIKGSTSHWINKHKLTKRKFSWQTGSCGFSVSYSRLNAVKQYIQKQKAHHSSPF